MLPPSFRLFMIALYGFIAWKFLTLGAVVVGAGILRSLQAELEWLALFPIGAGFLYVGATALERLRVVLTRQGPGF